MSIHDGLLDHEEPYFRGDVNILDGIDEEAFKPPECDIDLSDEITDSEWQMNFDEDEEITDSVCITEHFRTFSVDPLYLIKLAETAASLGSNDDKFLPEFLFSLTDSTISWRLYDGEDWGPVSTREDTYSLQIHLVWIQLKWTVFPLGSSISRELSIKIRDIEIIDNVATSQFRNLLIYQKVHNTPRETDSDMLEFNWQGVRIQATDRNDEEFNLNARILPLRFHLDQDTLHFILKFFKVGDPSTDKEHLPINRKTDNVFFRECNIEPIRMKIDYKSKNNSGDGLGLFNFVSLEEASLNLSQIRIYGVKGWRKLIDCIVNDTWVPHFKSTQMGHLASGLAIARPFVNLGTGVKDLFVLPVQRYKEDGRLFKGITEGITSFVKTTTIEAAKLGTKLVNGAQTVLERTEIYLGDDQATRSSKYTNSYQPNDIRQGISMGFSSLSGGIKQARNAVMTSEDLSNTIPLAMLQPLIGLADALSKTLIGIQNSLDGAQKKRSHDKYRSK